MGIRQKMNQHPAISASFGGAVLVVAVIFIIGHFRSEQRGGWPDPVTTAYFIAENSTDVNDLFTADLKQVPPFDHDGATAVRAHVFSCDGGSTLQLGYLEKYPDELKPTVEQAMQSQPRMPSFAPPSAAVRAPFETQALVKRPGGDWTRRSNAGDLVPKCPDGTPAAEQMPKQPSR